MAGRRSWLSGMTTFSTGFVAQAFKLTTEINKASRIPTRMLFDVVIGFIPCGVKTFLLFSVSPGDDPRSQKWPEDRHHGPEDGHRRGEHSNPLPTHALVLEGRFRRVFDDVVTELRLGVDGLGSLGGTGLGVEIDTPTHD